MSERITVRILGDTYERDPVSWKERRYETDALLVPEMKLVHMLPAEECYVRLPEGIAIGERVTMRRDPPADGIFELLAEERDAEGLVFGASATAPFGQSVVRRRALAAWGAAGLDPIGLQECRHTFASLSIAAGVNAKALSTYMGHANIAITLDRYGHLMPGNEDEAAALLNAYLERARAETVRRAEVAA